MLSIINVRKDLQRFTDYPERGITTKTPGYNAVPVCIGDRDVFYMAGDNSMQHEEVSVFLTGVKQNQDQEMEAKSAFPVLRLAPPVTTQV